MKKFSKEPVATIGIDLAKNSVHVFGVDAQGEAVFSRKLARGAVSAIIAQQPPCRIGKRGQAQLNFQRLARVN